MLCEVENVWARSGNTFSFSPWCHFILWKVLQPVTNACKIQSFWGFVFGFAFFTVEQREWGGRQRHCLQYVLKIKKARAAEKRLMSFLSVRILLCTHDTGLPMQRRGNEDWGLQLIIFVIRCHEEMGPDHPSKCLTFYIAFTALLILMVFSCYFTNSVLEKVNVDYNCCLDRKNYSAWLL